MEQRTITKTSFFPADVDAVWRRLSEIETLQYIAKPYASFAAIGGDTVWEPGRTYQMALKLFGLIPLGVHTIQVMQWDKDTLSILTHEGNAFVPLWNHGITLTGVAGGCRYTDRVTLNAGWKTPLVCLWARSFYGHRQRKWIKLLRKEGSNL